jgi:hypothetical protein
VEIGRLPAQRSHRACEAPSTAQEGWHVGANRRIAAPAPNVVSLMDALKRSLATEEAKSSEPAAKGKKAKKRAAGQREMLLSTAGKGRRERQSKDKAKELRDLPLVRGKLDTSNNSGCWADWTISAMFG